VRTCLATKESRGKEVDQALAPTGSLNDQRPRDTNVCEASLQGLLTLETKNTSIRTPGQPACRFNRFSASGVGDDCMSPEVPNGFSVMSPCLQVRRHLAEYPADVVRPFTLCHHAWITARSEEILPLSEQRGAAGPHNALAGN
jgi:hypothetical protein